MNLGCIFCKIISKELPATIVYEDDDVLAFFDIRPINLGHSLIVPKEHNESLYDTSDDTLCKLIVRTKEVSVAIKRATNADGINLEMNNEKAAGQIVFHSHIHIVPRFEGDGLKHWPGKLYSEGETKEVAKKIKEIISGMVIGKMNCCVSASASTAEPTAAKRAL